MVVAAGFVRLMADKLADAELAAQSKLDVYCVDITRRAAAEKKLVEEERDVASVCLSFCVSACLSVS